MITCIFSVRLNTTAVSELSPVSYTHLIGHGHLAWRALKPMVPVGEENPYAVRVVSDILESNGSSSMATVCARCV